MSEKRSSVPRPCILTVLEFSYPEFAVERAEARTLELVEEQLGDSKELRELGVVLIVAGSRAIRVVPLHSTGSVLFLELLGLVTLQAELSLLGVFTRGVVTVGDATVRPKVAVGPGVDAAVDLLDNIGEAPRIVVDHALLAEVENDSRLRSRHQSLRMELGYLRDLLRLSEDGLWYVDYLKAIRTELNDPDAYPQLLADHGERLGDSLRASTVIDSDFRAAHWLRTYHRTVVDEVAEQARLTPVERIRLRRTGTSPLLFSFPRRGRAPE